jgi:hypothetical protein
MYDMERIKFKGVDVDINFNIDDYEEDMKQVKKECSHCGGILFCWVYILFIE